MARCYVVPADDPYGHAGQQWCTDDANNFWQRREGVDPPVGGGGGSAPPTAPGTPTAPAGTVGNLPAGSVLPAGITPEAAAAARQLADNSAQIAYANKKLELDRTMGQQLDERERIRLAQEAAAQAWKQTYEGETLKQSGAKITGYTSTLGQGTGAKINQAGAALRENAAYQDLQRRAASGDQTAMAEKRKMETAYIANATGLPMDRAEALSNQLEVRRRATGGLLMGDEEIDRLLAQDPSYQTPTLEREQYGTDTALKYLTLRSQLRGPENAFAYAAMQRDTPESIRTLINQAAGRANLPGLAVPGAGQGGAAVAVDPRPGAGEMGPGTRSILTNGTPQAAVDPRPGVPNQIPNQIDPVTGLQRSSAWNPQDWQRASEYTKQLTLAGYEANGADKADVLEQYKRSLPKYSGALSGRLRAA